MEWKRRHQPGQSTVLLALMLVVVIGMAGLSVDVGNAYAQQRRVQNAANAGSLAGMNTMLRKGTNAQVWTSVKTSLAGNGIQPNNEYVYQADYICSGTTATRYMISKWDGTSEAPVSSGSPACDVARVEVTVKRTSSTYFAGVVGQDDLTVNESGAACLGPYGMGVYPLGVPKELRYLLDSRPFHKIYKVVDNGNGTVDSLDVLVESTPSDSHWNGTTWGNWSRMQNMVLYIPVQNVGNQSGEDYYNAPGTHVGWLSWDGNNGAAKLKDSFRNPGDLQKDFVEFGDAPGSGEEDGSLDVGDWINGDTGVKSTVDGELETLLYDEVLLPMYDKFGKENGKSAFHFVQMGRFRIVGFDLSQRKGLILPPPAGGKYIMVQYIGDAAGHTGSGGTASTCS